ncbi:MAG TPA: hypothetical protein VEA16_11180, partial [Vicinamibacterales bacterium]|nr:hypothetical protein [Vicinamibacterales bacterium]
MPSLLELQWVGALIGIGVGVAALIKLVPPGVRIVGRWTWQPVVAHFQGVHRMFTTVDSMVGEISEIRKELTTNGGRSLKDHVMQTAVKVEAIGDRVETIEARQSAVFDAQMR